MTWPERDFESLYAIPSKNGLTRPSRVRGVGYKMINMGELFAHDRIGAIQMERVPMNEKEISTMLVECGDLLFARQSLVLSGAGKCSLVQELEEPTTFESHIIRVRLRKDIADPGFFYYYFKSPRSGIRSIVTQGVQAGIRANDLRLLKVHLPPLRDQQRIASILSAYDDLIENNRRRIQLLEQSARLLYKEWFVHLRFPGHEHVKVKDGVPEGWSLSTLGQICLDDNGIQTGPFGSQLHQSDYSDEGIPVVMPRELAGNKVSTQGIARVPEEIAQRLGRHQLQVGDTVYGRRGDIGRRAYIRKREAGWLCGTGCLRLRPDTCKIDPRYFFDALGSSQTEGTIVARAQGVTMPNLNATIMRSVELLVPSPSVQNTYVEHINPLDELISILGTQNERLAKARDLVLPRLMSGELAV